MITFSVRQEPNGEYRVYAERALDGKVVRHFYSSPTKSYIEEFKSKCAQAVDEGKFLNPNYWEDA